MIFKLLNGRHLEFLSLNGGCTGSSESTLVKMPYCWKSRVTALVHHANKTSLTCHVCSSEIDVLILTRMD